MQVRLLQRPHPSRLHEKAKIMSDNIIRNYSDLRKALDACPTRWAHENTKANISLIAFGSRVSIMPYADAEDELLLPAHEITYPFALSDLKTLVNRADLVAEAVWKAYLSTTPLKIKSEWLDWATTDTNTQES